MEQNISNTDREINDLNSIDFPIIGKTYFVLDTNLRKKFNRLLLIEKIEIANGKTQVFFSYVSGADCVELNKWKHWIHNNKIEEDLPNIMFY